MKFRKCKRGKCLKQGTFPFFNLAGYYFMNQYRYDGPVMEFENCVAYRWKSSTNAVSAKKARSNLMYQFKKQNNMLPNTKITLPGKLMVV